MQCETSCAEFIGKLKLVLVLPVGMQALGARLLAVYRRSRMTSIMSTVERPARQARSEIISTCTTQNLVTSH